MQSQLQECTTQQRDTSDNSRINQDDMLTEILGRDKRGRLRNCGLSFTPSNISEPNPTHAEALRMVAEANSEVREMKERMATMEQTCAQMATQMSTMMVMMSNMQKSPASGQSDFVRLISSLLPLLVNVLFPFSFFWREIMESEWRFPIEKEKKKQRERKKKRKTVLLTLFCHPSLQKQNSQTHP